MYDVAVIGAGASGVAVAAHLALVAPNAHAALIDPAHGQFGPAYRTDNGRHLLNVRAANMSLYAAQPDHFVNWLAANYPQWQSADFAPRKIYRSYLNVQLQSLLRHPLHYDLIPAEATDISVNEGFAITLSDGRILQAHQTVLAVGNQASDLPLPLGRDETRQPPWLQAWDFTDGGTEIRQEAAILIVGGGLTMVDYVLSLIDHGHTGPITVLSRHGLFPRRHSPAPGAADMPAPESFGLNSLLAQFRRSVSINSDWRAAIDAWRPCWSEIWRNLPDQERGRFLRHLRPLWEVHRHRIAPEIWDLLDHQRRSGRMAIVAGRLLEASILDNGRIGVGYRRRGDSALQSAEFDHVVAATGLEGDLTRIRMPLVRNLLKRGLIMPDRHRLGLAATADGQVLSAQGTVVSGFYTLGSLLRGILWESTAIPEIRSQAEQLAQHLAASVRASAEH